MKNRVPSKPTETTFQNSQIQRKGLVSPSDDVVTVCKTAESVLRSTPNLFSTNKILEKLMICAKQLLLDTSLFAEMDMFVEHTVLSNYKLDLINFILKKYFNIRLYHEAKCSQDIIQRIRSFHNRIVVFKNQ